jgi:hypothetical protein
MGSTLHLHARALLACGDDCAAEALLSRSLEIRIELGPSHDGAAQEARTLLEETRRRLALH